MISSMSKFVSLFLCRNNIIHADELEIYQYGFEIVISTILGFLLTVTIGIVLHMFVPSLLYYAIFVFVRQMTGGYHAKTYFRCNLVFTIVSFLTMGITKISLLSEQYTFLNHTLILVAAVLTILLYAPVENPNKPLDSEQRAVNHKRSVVSTVVLSASSCGLYFITPQISLLISFTLCAVAILIMVAIMGKGGESSEEGN